MSEGERAARPVVLVVEDDPSLRGLLEEELTDAGYTAVAVSDAAAARARLQREPPALVVSDLRLPGEDGFALLEAAKRLPAPPSFIMITAFGTIEQAVEALKHGADDFLTKPLKLDHLRLSAQRVLETRNLREEVGYYRSLLGASDFHGMIGRSPPVRALFDSIRQVANAAGPVLVTGESGVGKELVACAIHAESPRAAGPFVAVNCAGIPPELLESELFGHAAGAFTGAQRARKGLFAEAHGGTLLLDEIGEMPLEMQSKLLRILQDSRVRPIGANREQHLDVRVIAATHRDLDVEVAAGRFREDLFYRLETFALHVPRLRDRGDDLELLAARFIARVSAQLGREVCGLTPAALGCLRAYPFPGNIRELANAMERAVTFCTQGDVDVQHLPERIRRHADSGGPAEQENLEALWTGEAQLPPLEEVERRYIRLVLDRVGGNKRRAAAMLGIGRRTVYRRLGLSEGAQRDDGD